MSTYRKTWDCCGDTTETEAWEPETCPFCTTTPTRTEFEAAAYRWLLENARLSWDLDYENVQIVFPLDAEFFISLDDAVAAAMGWPTVPEVKS